MKNILVYSLLAAAAFGATSGDAFAAVEDMQNVTNAASICHGSRAVDEANLSSTALEIRNDGTSAAFVSCSFTTTLDQGGGGGVDMDNVRYWGVFFTNKSAVDASVKCTGVQGYANGGSNVYTAMTTTVPANNVPSEDGGYIFFERESAQDPLFYQNVSMTCILPVGVGIADTYVGYVLDDNAGNIPTAAP